jgi:hypothetical protein
VQRLGPPGLRDELRQAVFHTGDAETNRLLEMTKLAIIEAQMLAVPRSGSGSGRPAAIERDRR